MTQVPAMSLVDSLLEAFKLIWGMYGSAIQNIPEEHWRTGEVDYLIPARLVYHAVQTGDFYSEESPDDFPWGHRFGGGCFEVSPEGLPTPEQVWEYHEEVREKVAEWIKRTGDPGLMSREEAFPWTGGAVLGRALYLLGHYRQHFGELNAELRRRGLPRIPWTTY